MNGGIKCYNEKKIGGNRFMYTTGKSLKWELKKSFHLVLLTIIPLINSIVYFFMNRKIKQKKWKIMGGIFFALQLFVVLVIIFANVAIGSVNNYGSSPKLEDYLGTNYYAKYGSDYKASPEYEEYLKDLEEWEETSVIPEQEEKTAKLADTIEKIKAFTILFSCLLYIIIFTITCVERRKYLKLLSEEDADEVIRFAEEEMENSAVVHQTAKSEVKDSSVVLQSTESEVQGTKEGLSMRWFEFIIYIQLFLNMALNLFNAVNLISGNIYRTRGLEAVAVYDMYPGMQMLDKLRGIMYLAFIVFVIIVRQRLAKYKKNGPQLYLAFLVVQMLVLGIVFDFIAYLMIQNGNFASIIRSVVLFGIVFVGNKIYFNKRKDLFIN